MNNDPKTGTIYEFSDEDLKMELERREKKNKEIPRPLDNIDWNDLIIHCIDHLGHCASETYHEDNDDKQYIYI